MVDSEDAPCLVTNLFRILSFSPVTQNKAALGENKTELHCFLNTFKGRTMCRHHSGIIIKWLNEDNIPLEALKGSRFHISPSDNCFHKLSFTQKLTDHRMKWRCQVNQGESVKATVNYTTSIKGRLLN